MLFIKLAYKNVRASFHDYLLYFLTLSLSVSLFYCFNTSGSLQLVNDQLALSSGIPRLLDTLSNLMRSLSGVVALILTVLVLYANRLFLLRRKEEFALYYVLGMRQRQLILVVMLEAFFIALLALGVGIVFGILLSQIVCTFTASLFIARVQYRFVFSLTALLLTLAAFCAIFFFTAMINLLLLYRSHTRSDKGKRVRPLSKKGIWGFPAALLCFFPAAFLLITQVSPLGFFCSLFLLCGANFAFFLGLRTLVSQPQTKTPSLCCRRLHLLAFHQLCQQLKRHTLLLCVLSAMLTVGITFLFSGLCISNQLSSEVEGLTPYSVSLIHRYTLTSSDDAFNQRFFEEKVAQLHPQDDSIIYERILHTYRSSFTYEKLCKLLEENDLHIPWELTMLKDMPIEIIPLSAYNQLRRDHGLEEVKLPSNSAYLYSCNSRFAATIEELRSQHPHIMIYSHSLRISPLAIDALRPGSVEDSLPQDAAILVVSDRMLPNNALGYGDYWNIELRSSHSGRAFADQIDQKLAKDHILSKSDDRFYTANRDEAHENSVGSSVIFTYIALYIGITFIISTGVILALTLLSPAYNDRASHTLLIRLGAPTHMRRQNICMQTTLCFLLPLAPALLDSLLILKALSTILYEFGKNGYAMAFLQTSLILCFLYLSYLILTCANRLAIADTDQL